MTSLDEAFALVRENGLTWHTLYEDRGEWYVRLKTVNTHNAKAAYGFGQHVDLPESIRQAILAAKEWEAWRPKITEEPVRKSRTALVPEFSEEDIQAAIELIKERQK